MRRRLSRLLAGLFPFPFAPGCVDRNMAEEIPERDPVAICSADCDQRDFCTPSSGDAERDEAGRRSCFDQCVHARDVYNLADEACWFLFLDWRACLATLDCEEYPETPGSGCEDVNAAWAESNLTCVLTHADESYGDAAGE